MKNGLLLFRFHAEDYQFGFMEVVYICVWDTRIKSKSLSDEAYIKSAVKFNRTYLERDAGTKYMERQSAQILSTHSKNLFNKDANTSLADYIFGGKMNAQITVIRETDRNELLSVNLSDALTLHHPNNVFTKVSPRDDGILSSSGYTDWLDADRSKPVAIEFIKNAVKDSLNLQSNAEVQLVDELIQKIAVKDDDDDADADGADDADDDADDDDDDDNNQDDDATITSEMYVTITAEDITTDYDDADDDVNDDDDFCFLDLSEHDTKRRRV